MNKNTPALAVDLYFLFCIFTIVTGGYFFPEQIITIFGDGPKAYRLPLNLVAASAVLLAAMLHVRSGAVTNSSILRFFTQGKFNPKWILVLMYASIASVYSVSSVVKHATFQSSFDFSIFAQAIWNTWQGHFLYSSIKGGICILGDHVSPMLALFAPLYGIWSNPSVLLVAQAVLGTSAVFPIYFIAREVLKQDRLALLFPLAFCLYQPLRNSVRFDFHPELVGDPLLLWAFYFILRNKLRTASLFLFGVLMTKEVACGPVAIMGLYSWWFQKRTWFGIGWFLIAVVYFFLAVQVIAPNIAGWEYAYLSGNYLNWQERGGVLAFLSHMTQASTFTYLKKIFLPIGFFSFLSPTTLLLTLPTLMQNLAAPGPLTRSTYFQYTTFLTSFAFISAIFGFRNYIQWADTRTFWNPSTLKRLAIYWLIGTSLVLTGGSEIRTLLTNQSKDNAHYAYIRNYIREFPTDAAVRTHEFFAPHFAMREELHIYENGHPREGGSERALDSEYVVIDERFLKEPAQRAISKLRQRGYTKAHEHNGFYVFRK